MVAKSQLPRNKPDGPHKKGLKAINPYKQILGSKTKSITTFLVIYKALRLKL